MDNNGLLQLIVVGSLVVLGIETVPQHYGHQHKQKWTYNGDDRLGTTVLDRLSYDAPLILFLIDTG